MAPPDPAVLGQNPFTLLSLIGAPAVLTNAASVLALSTSNRFLRASERMRALSEAASRGGGPAARGKQLVLQASRTERQALLLLRALRAAYLALGAFACASLISVLGAGLASSPLKAGFHVLVALALAVGFFGAGGLVWACANLMRATRLSMLNMSEEAQLIRESNHQQQQQQPSGP
jgi:hypothetical protein